MEALCFGRHRFITGKECMSLQGFPIESLSLDDHTNSELIFLAGNAMSIPVIGAVMCAGLVSVDWGPDRSTQSSQDLLEPMTTRTDLRKQFASNPGNAPASLQQLSWREDDVFFFR